MKIRSVLPLAALCIVSLLSFSLAYAEVRQTIVEYKDGDQVLEGVYFQDTAIKGKQPAVLIVHDWMGVSDDTKKRAKMIVDLGYSAFVADIYGKGIRPKDSNEAMTLVKKFKADQPLMRSRVNAALDAMKLEKAVHPSKIAVIGYCFGGTVGLELARSGAPIAGVVSFHGGLASARPEDAKNIKGRILAIHGADDPLVPDAEVAGFEKEMRDAKVDWELIKFGNAVHAFTVKGAGDDPSKGFAYNELADHRSWEAMAQFFAEVF